MSEWPASSCTTCIGNFFAQLVMAERRRSCITHSSTPALPRRIRKSLSRLLIIWDLGVHVPTFWRSRILLSRCGEIKMYGRPSFALSIKARYSSTSTYLITFSVVLRSLVFSNTFSQYASRSTQYEINWLCFFKSHTRKTAGLTNFDTYFRWHRFTICYFAIWSSDPSSIRPKAARLALFGFELGLFFRRPKAWKSS